MKKFNIFKSKKTAVLVLIIFISIITIALSYAFFASYIGSPANTSVGIDSEASEKLIFNKGENINIYATQENFAEGDGSLSGTTTSNATLIANKSVGTADDIYQIYFDIHINNFEYTVDNATPELLLEIMDPSGNKITTLEGFTYKTVIDSSTGTTLTGFDITEFEGLIKIKEDEAISTTSYTDGTKEEWSAKITFVNLTTNQYLNEGKTLEADFILQKDKLTVNEMISGPDFNDLMEISGFRDTATQIIFDKQIDEGYETATDKWDLSTEGNESIIAYIENSGEEQILHIQSNRKIMANNSQSYTFRNFNKITKLEFNDWYNTSNVTDMSNMFNMMIGNTYSPSFQGYSYLKNLDLSSFDTSKVTNMSWMFNGLESIENLDISSFDTTSVKNMSFMFAQLRTLKTLDIRNLDTSNVTEMRFMFGFVSSLVELNLNNFDTNKVTNMSSMFANMNNLENIKLTSFDTSNVNNMTAMFSDMRNLNEIDLKSFDTSNVTSMSAMFSGASSLTNLDLSSFNTSNVTSMSSMFSDVSSLKSLNLSNFNTSKVTNMHSMFSNLDLLTSLNIENFDTKNVTSMSYMFMGLELLTSLNISNFNTSNVTSMHSMFNHMTSLTSINIANFNTEKVTNMYSMFGNTGLTSIDLSSFDMSNVTSTNLMFGSSNKIKEAYAKTQADADVLNASSNKPTTFTFVATE